VDCEPMLRVCSISNEKSVISKPPGTRAVYFQTEQKENSVTEPSWACRPLARRIRPAGVSMSGALWASGKAMKSVRGCLGKAELDLHTLIWTRGGVPAHQLTGPLKCPVRREGRSDLRHAERAGGNAHCWNAERLTMRPLRRPTSPPAE
jgi:hypothetical protein